MTTSLSLDDLLTESLQQTQLRKDLRKVGGTFTPETKAQELKLLWKPVAVCEMWSQVNCACGSSHAHFTQYMMQYEQHGRDKTNSVRWRSFDPDAEATPQGLPLKTIYQQTEVSHCSECSAPEEGSEVIIWDGSENVRALEGEM